MLIAHDIYSRLNRRIQNEARKSIVKKKSINPLDQVTLVLAHYG
jgi:hypothetical protein